MGSVRFSRIVETAGKPEAHLLWADPARDRALQAAIKARRVMTIHQETVGTKTDYGTVGFRKDVPGQILIFPRSIKAFEGERVVGVKYDLIEAPVVPKQERAPKAKPRKRRPGRAPAEARNRAEASKQPALAEDPAGKVIDFPGSERTRAKRGRSEEVEEIKRQVRRAMKVLEQGKQVAAFNLLKRIVDS